MVFFIPHLSYSFTKLPGHAKVSARFPLYLSGDQRMQDTATSKIHKLEVTDDTLTSRGGLAFFVKYLEAIGIDRKSTRLNSSHGYISYAVFCLKKKRRHGNHTLCRRC